ncbi:MAG: hypothetical protein ACI92Z_002792 [Paracoccaceae bacterium]|jgi:hypothetical protein
MGGNFVSEIAKDDLHPAFALGLLTRRITRPADSFGFLRRGFLGWFFEMLPKFHVANTHLHVVSTSFPDMSCKDLQGFIR